MRKSLAAGLLLASAALPAAAASQHCFTAADLEAAHALVLQTSMGVLSSACNEDVMYGEFKVRNQNALIAYQQAMIAHFHRTGYGNGEHQFETWFTHLANQAAIQHAGLPSPATCVQTVSQLKLDPQTLHDYLSAHAADPVDGDTTCLTPRHVTKVTARRVAVAKHQ